MKTSFKIGDRVIAHNNPSQGYMVTKPGWRGVITKIVPEWEHDLHLADAGWAKSIDFVLDKEDAFNKLYLTLKCS